MSGMRRPLAGDFVKCKHPLPATKGIEFTSLCRSVLVAVPPMSAITLNDTEFSPGDLWVFGYGSLMWRPGFEFIERVPARLIGEHRALCVYSFVHRGTPEKPGLVLGLDRGGACRGIVFRVKAGAEQETIAYLREREQVTAVYVEAFRKVKLLDDSGRTVDALTYLVDRNHAQYAGALPLEEQLRLVRGGKGQSGANIDYVLNTLRHLQAEGVHDPRLAALAARLTG
jgi:cation transport protein ChaC